MIDGRKNGIGQEYYKNGEIMYQGYFKNDQWHGDDCIIYNYEGEYEYKGDMYRGMRDGQGKQFHFRKIIYQLQKFLQRFLTFILLLERQNILI